MTKIDKNPDVELAKKMLEGLKDEPEPKKKFNLKDLGTGFVGTMVALAVGTTVLAAVSHATSQGNGSGKV